MGPELNKHLVLCTQRHVHGEAAFAISTRYYELISLRFCAHSLRGVYGVTGVTEVNGVNGVTEVTEVYGVTRVVRSSLGRVRPNR